jgi:5-methylcytosine-specific restriction endonuclease McrA
MKICKVKDCGRKTNTNGYCNMHHKRLIRHGSIDKPTRICLHCGKIFTPIKNTTQANYCSKECYNKSYYLSRMIDYDNLTCKQCGRTFNIKTVATNPPLFCSNQCKGKFSAIKRKTIINCKICGKEFITANKFEPVCTECAYKNRIVKTVKRNFIRKGLRRGACGPTHTQKDWEKLLNKYDGLCAYCGKEKATQRDHVIPISKGGTDSIGNILPVCGKCNATKATKLLSQYRYKNLEFTGALI